MGILLQEAPQLLSPESQDWQLNPTFGRIQDMGASAEGRGVPRSAWLRSRALLLGTQTPEKVKVSLTLDKKLVDEVRAHFGGEALSTVVNELLHAAMAQERLAELVAEMEAESGPASPEAYERVMEQWLAE